ncbi:T9SS type A sorting domain-containing protein [Fulvivirga sp. 29W222]|uniref:T9SS type A sorting domain-containing protein n=1 Tax=Fulvivirga marina TaxID=2494733 RepID=A0A937FTM9_9BACT|nr:T9SS type A sorting domain-containing protein [Fulvivirga marina]
MCLGLQAQSIFINEIHYDNDGADTQEGVEIAGPAGTDLSGWALEFYNGSGGALYATVSLSGVIANEQGGYGAIFFDQAGVQNGAPDGVVLVDAANNVIQFLSYEGSFTAVGGSADGQISTDIIVSESGSTAIGNSLQLTGTGTDYTDFNWQNPSPSSYNSINDGQSFGTIVINPVINEFVFNHTGSDTNEFVEILGAANTDYSDLWLLEIEGDSPSTGIVDEAIQLGTTDASGFWTTGTLSNAFENGSLSLLLVRNFTGSVGDDLDPEDDGVLDTLNWESVLDVVGVYDGGADDLNYLGTVLAADFDGSTFTVGGASRVPDGQDTDMSSDWVRNSFSGAGLPDFPTAEAAPGEAINTIRASNQVQAGPAAVLVINEVDADTEGTDVAEFVELFDGGAGNTSLDGLVLVFYNGSNDQSYNAFDLTGYTTNAQGYFVLGNVGVPNVSIEFPSNGLQNGADAVALYLGTAADFPSGTLVTDTNLVDAIVYDTNDSDDAGLLTLLNASQPQVNEDMYGSKDGHSLQRYPNGEGGLRNTDTYNAALPTPGAANTNLTEPLTIVINEIDVDTPGSDEAEFIELYDGGVGNSSLGGLVVVFYNGNGDASYNAIDLDGYSTNAEGYFVLGNAGVTNVDLIFSNNGLQNGADAIALYQADATDFPSGTLVHTANLIDAVVYDTNDSDDAELLVLLNAGEPQLNEDAAGNKDNESLQRVPNGSGGARNTSSFATQAPTPGAENGGGIVVPGEVITIAEARAKAVGESVTILGILTATDHFGGPAYIQDSTAGIAIFDASIHGDMIFQIGDSIKVTAVRGAFNDQEQLSGVSAMENYGPANSPIVPKVISLGEMSLHSGELVTVTNVTFPQPGHLLFGNSNYAITDASGSGELRLDADVEDLVGYAQPDTCSAITGVIGRFMNIYQLLPRQSEDMPCAEKYQPQGDDLGIPVSETFDVAAWNIEWFGDESNSPAAGNPNSDAIQKDSVKVILQQLDADIIAVEEITDLTLFDQLISELPGYSYVMSSATSYPGSADAQHVGFIYNTATVSPDTTESRVLLESIHPLYNGGDASHLTGYPDTPSRFWASGRLPYMFVADVTINGVTKRVNLVAVHARANGSSGAQSRYDMRKYDVEVLKDSLDTYYADANLIMLGDYNDDLDFTVADGVSSTASTYEVYVSDTASYELLSLPLSEQGFRSYVFRENMIDHIITSDELADEFIEGSARVGYQYYDSDYASTVSDHMIVSARFIFEEEVTFNDFTAVNVVSFVQGKRRNRRPVHWLRSNPGKALGRPLENFYFNFVSLGFGGEITLELDNYMYDLSGNEFKLFESTFGPLNLPCEWYPETAEVFASENGSDFYSLGTTCQDGEFDLASAGMKKAKFIRIKDVSETAYFFGNADGYDVDGIYNLIPDRSKAAARTSALEDHENYVPNEVNGFEVSVYPNPFTSHVNLTFASEDGGKATVQVLDIMGRVHLNQEVSFSFGVEEHKINMENVPEGIYIIKVQSELDGLDQTIKVVKE